MTVSFDIGIARNIHLKWELALEKVVSEGGPPIHLASHGQCELSHWLLETGLRKYWGNESTHKIVDIHRRFHQTAEEIIDSLKVNDFERVKRGQGEVRSMSRDIVFLLTEIELTFLAAEQWSSDHNHPIRNLFRKVFQDPSYVAPMDHKVLEVAHARLVHLRWTRELSNLFHKQEGDASLESSGACVLGAWIRDVGIANHHNMAEMQELQEAHELFHSLAEKTIHALGENREAVALQSYQEVLQKSREIIYLLSVLENKLLDSGEIAPSVNILEGCQFARRVMS